MNDRQLALIGEFASICKEKFPEWRPDLPPRPEHQTDIARLREALTTGDGAHEVGSGPSTA
jgi:hypothetical protein